MKAINILKTSLIDKILAIQNKEFLEALETIVNSSSSEKPVSLTDSQMQMLLMSEEDMKYGRLTSQEDLDAEDIAWLSEQ